MTKISRRRYLSWKMIISGSPTEEIKLALASGTDLETEKTWEQWKQEDK